MLVIVLCAQCGEGIITCPDYTGKQSETEGKLFWIRGITVGIYRITVGISRITVGISRIACGISRIIFGVVE